MFFCRDLIAEDIYESSQQFKIGGPGCIVEIDESMFGKKKLTKQAKLVIHSPFC